LIRINDRFSRQAIFFADSEREVMMPFDSVVVSVAVTAVFIGFALVLAWADRRSRPAEGRAGAGEAK
jgi:hypothetical protein